MLRPAGEKEFSSNLEVWPEVVAPLRNAVALVNHNAGVDEVRHV
jgi:hypothetical protein